MEYIPKKGELYYYDKLTLIIHTKAKSSEFRVQSSGNETLERVKRIIDNPEMLSTYQLSTPKTPLRGEGRGEPKPSNSIDYLIITSEVLKPYFSTLSEFKTLRGIKTEIVSVESIYTNVSGIDKQDKIRNLIKYFYNNYGTNYVLLGGDDEIIPHRGLFDMVNEATDYVYIDDDIASDLYYGGLDGNWNTNGDTLWGEPNEADLYAEVYVGRASVKTPNEVINFTNKTIAYQNNPKNVTSALMTGEDLGWAVWGSQYKEEIRQGAETWGDTTVGFPVWFGVDTLYDNANYHWATQDMIDALNKGYHLINHLGHAGVSYAMKISNDDIPKLINDTCFSIIYSQGCYCNSFDNRESDGSYYWDDAISEYLTKGKYGAVAFLGNTRYGWGDYASTDGSSQFYDRAFFDGLFGKHIYKIGNLLQYSKEANIPLLDQDAMRWCYYEICLFGDPELDIWTDTPTNLTVVYPESLHTDTSSYTITVTQNGGSPVESAFICLSMDSTIYVRGFTTASGKFICKPSPSNIGEMKVTATHHNNLPYYGSAAVIKPAGTDTPIISYYKTTSQYVVSGDSLNLPALG